MHDPDPLIKSLLAVGEYTGIWQGKLRRLIAYGDFPKPKMIKNNKNRNVFAWNKSDIDKWMKDNHKQ